MFLTRMCGETYSGRSKDALFRKVARALGGREYRSRLDCWTEDGREQVYEITATTYLPRQGCSEINGRAFVTVRKN